MTIDPGLSTLPSLVVLHPRMLGQNVSDRLTSDPVRP